MSTGEVCGILKRCCGIIKRGCGIIKRGCGIIKRGCGIVNLGCCILKRGVCSMAMSSGGLPLKNDTFFMPFFGFFGLLVLNPVCGVFLN